MSIKVNDLHYSYFSKTPNAQQALKGVNFEIDQGSFVAFVGETGSGKSTLMQTLNHLLIPTQGSIDVDDIHIRARKADRKINKNLRRNVGFVFQFPEYQLFEETVLKDVCYGPKNFGFKEEEAIERAKKALTFMNIDESFYERSPFELSGGEKKRVATAGVIASEPNILIFDEPTVGMDVRRKKQVMDLMLSLKEQGKTVLLVSHDMDVVLKCCDKVIVLSDGKIAFNGEPNELFIGEETYGLECPKSILFAKELVKHGYQIDIKKIKTIDDLADQIKEVKHG